MVQPANTGVGPASPRDRRLLSWNRLRLPRVLRTHPGALVGLAAGLFALFVLGRFVTDDAAITLRYSKHLASGLGIRWNPGEHPVEGYTNFSHVLIGAAAIELGLPALSLLRLLNQGCMLVLCVLVYALAFDVLRSRSWATAASVMVGLHAPLAYWSSSGLETALYSMASYAGILAARRVRSPRALWPALFLLLAALTRLEGAVMFVAVVAALAITALFSRDATPLRARGSALLRMHGRWITLFVLVYGAYFGWRWFYFGHLLSNSAYYKLDGAESGDLVSAFVQQTLALFVLACFADFRKLGEFGWLVGLLVLAHIAGYFNAAGVVGYFHRFFLPVFPGLVIVGVSALTRLWPATAERAPVRRAIVLCALLLALALDVLHPDVGIYNVLPEIARLDSRILARAQVARFIAERFDAKAAVVIEDVGVVGFVLPNPIIDALGLNNEGFVHAFGRDAARFARAVMKQQPALVVLVSDRVKSFRALYPSGEFFTQVAGFDKHYAQLAVVRSHMEDYHYFIFARRKLFAPQRYSFGLHAVMQPALTVDDLFHTVRSPPPNSRVTPPLPRAPKQKPKPTPTLQPAKPAARTQ